MRRAKMKMIGGGYFYARISQDLRMRPLQQSREMKRRYELLLLLPFFEALKSNDDMENIENVENIEKLFKGLLSNSHIGSISRISRVSHISHIYICIVYKVGGEELGSQ